MTTTETTYEPCPASWCEHAGHHRFDDELLPDSHGEHVRLCTHREPTISGSVTTEVFTRADGTVTEPVVCVDLDDTGGEVRSAYDAGVLINSIVRAAETAWPGFREQYRQGWVD